MEENRYGADGNVHDSKRLKELQSLPLSRKIGFTQARIIEWYKHFKGNVYVSLSGGKDSAVLYHIVHSLFPDVPAVFSNTGLEYPEISDFAKEICTEVVTPKMSFTEVIKTYGYPIISKEVSEAIYYARRNKRGGERNRGKQMELLGIRPQCSRTEYWNRQTNSARAKQQSENEQNCLERDKIHIPQTNVRRKILMGSCKTSDGTMKSAFNKEKWLLVVYLPFKISHYCCNVMKKSPLSIYQRRSKRYPYIGTLADESRMRKQAWIRHGCNAFDSKKKTSQPLSFWTEQDILEYIRIFNLDICSVYGDIETLENGDLHFTGAQRTGCVFCGFGAHLEKGTDRRFLRLKETHPQLYDYCMRGGHWEDNSEYNPHISSEPDEMGWIAWNPKKIWTPHKGLGMAYVFDSLNEIYGEEFIKYK